MKSMSPPPAIESAGIDGEKYIGPKQYAEVNKTPAGFYPLG